jgi:soluble lytic murein transglycosylase-like protein
LRDDPCTNVGVAAWILRSHIDESLTLGNAIAKYNEGTDEENEAFKEEVVSIMHRHGLIKIE